MPLLTDHSPVRHLLRRAGLPVLAAALALAVGCADPECGSDDLVALNAPADGFAVNIDRFEATRGDGDLGCSVSGASVWTSVSYDKAKSACSDAGKRLCTLDEWQRACRSVALQQDYPYGPTFDAARCNVQATGRGAIAAAGELTECKTLQDVFDLSGNAREWVDGPDGPLLAGGSFASSQLDAQCGSFISPTADFEPGNGTGFRCCSD